MIGDDSSILLAQEALPTLLGDTVAEGNNTIVDFKILPIMLFIENDQNISFIFEKKTQIISYLSVAVIYLAIHFDSQTLLKQLNGKLVFLTPLYQVHTLLRFPKF